MKKNRFFALVMAALLLLSSCGGGASMDSVASSPEMDKNMSVEAPAAPAPESSPGEWVGGLTYSASTSKGESGSVYQRADAKLIRRCRVELQTTEFDAAVSSMYDLVEELGGYFENSSVYGGGYYNANARRSGEYIIRIPAEKYNVFHSGVGELGYVTFSNESTEDIGEQYYDTEARLKTLRTKQERLQMLLEKAETMEDIISLESALGEVEYQIESYSGTLNRYDGLVNFATFTININEVVRVEESAGEADSLGKRMSVGFRSGLENLRREGEDALVWLSYNIVGLVIFLAVTIVVVMILRRKKPSLPRLRNKKNAPKDGE